MGASSWDQAQSKHALPDEAARHYTAAIALQPGSAAAHNNFGNALSDLTKLHEAIAEYRQAIQIKPDYALAHYNLGNALYSQGKLEPAIAEYRQAIQIEPDRAEAHNNLGNALSDVKKLDEAIAEYHQAIRIKPEHVEAHNNLGAALRNQGKLIEAIAEIRKAIGIRPEYANAHYNLGLALQFQGKRKEALAAYRRAAELAPKDSAVAKDLLIRIPKTERMIALDSRLPAILKRTDRPKDTTERLAFAQMAYGRGLHAGAARLWAEALTADPKLGDDRQVQHRYNAACAAALAGCGEGKDDPAPDDGAKARLRRQAFDWLKSEISAWSKALESIPPQNRPVVRHTLDHWRQDRDLAGVRDPAALDRLPEPERADWQELWSEVEALRARAAVSAP